MAGMSITSSCFSSSILPFRTMDRHRKQGYSPRINRPSGTITSPSRGVFTFLLLLPFLFLFLPYFTLGGAITCDAHHPTDPRSDGLGISACITKSLLNGGVSPEEVCKFIYDPSERRQIGKSLDEFSEAVRKEQEQAETSLPSIIQPLVVM